MNKREFLQKLREYLSYELPARYIEKNIRYYDEYIDTEVSSGKTISDVIEELGDPQLIAKTITDSIKSGADGIPNSEDDVDFTEEIYENGGPEVNQRAPRFGSRDGYDRSDSAGYGSRGSGSSAENFEADDSGDRPEGASNGWHVFSTGNGGCLFLSILIILVMFCIFSVIGTLLGALSPILAPVCIVFLVLWLLERRN